MRQDGRVSGIRVLRPDQRPVEAEPGDVRHGDGAAQDPAARHEADFGVAAVVAVGVIGEQVVMPRRNHTRHDRFQRATVERMRLGPAHPHAVEEDRPVRSDRDPHPRHAAHGLEIRNRRAQGFRGIEQHPVADFRRLAEQREGGIAPGFVRPARVDVHARDGNQPQRRQRDHHGQADAAPSRLAVPQAECRAPRAHRPSPRAVPVPVSGRRARSSASTASTSPVRSGAPAATARAGSSTTP